MAGWEFTNGKLTATVNVRATDSSGAATDADATNAIPDDATVTITLVDVDEKPVFLKFGDTNPATANGFRAIMVVEGNTALAATDDVENVTYKANDPEGQNVTYRLMGDDGALFQLNDAADPDHGEVLSFRAKPDFEKPADKNKDNLYEFTIRAFDRVSGGLYADLMVRVRVSNDLDEAPTIATGAGDTSGTTGTTTISYKENDTKPVAAFTSAAPDGATITWSLLTATGGTESIPGVDTVGGDDVTDTEMADHTHFDISKQGVLTFDIGGDADNPDKSVPPNYEAPKGVLTATPTAAANRYSVVGASYDATTGKTGYWKVVVNVTNVTPEAGVITWTVDYDADGEPDTMPKLLQFEPGALIIATLSDPDDSGGTIDIRAPEWSWYRSSGKGFPVGLPSAAPASLPSPNATP